MAHEMKRLSRRVNALGRVKALERENALLRGMLEDAVGLCDAALAHEDARKRLEELVERVPPKGASQR